MASNKTLRLRLTRKDGADVVVVLVRPDGTATGGRLGAEGFGAIHDLAHYVVETRLGLRHGFLGLVADGWNLPDFAAKGASRRVPDEAIVAECIVLQLTNHAFADMTPVAGEFSETVRAAVEGTRPGAAVPDLDDGRVAELWTTLQSLLARLRALPAGDTHELAVEFNPASRQSPAPAPDRRGPSPTRRAPGA